MSGAALTAARVLWPAFRRILVRIGRWVARRLRKHGAKRLADRMEKRARGYQTRRMLAAHRRGARRIADRRGRQIGRWLNAAMWLRENAKQLGRGVGKALDALAWEDRIPMTLPGEGSVR